MRKSMRTLLARLWLPLDWYSRKTRGPCGCSCGFGGAARPRSRTQNQNQPDPPGRVARLNYIQGSVSFQPAGTAAMGGCESQSPAHDGR